MTSRPSICVVATSDLHGYLPEIPPCDLLLIGGDICPDGDEEHQAQWLDGPFRRWLEHVSVKEIVGVAGNHDWVFQNRPDLVPTLPWHYLLDSGISLFGLTIWGSPWQPVFYDWAFNLTEQELAQKWALIPEGTDILLLHGPPYRHGDRNELGENTGSLSLMKRIELIQPALVVCGHIHEARGAYFIGSSRVLNVSQRDLAYRPHADIVQLQL